MTKKTGTTSGIKRKKGTSKEFPVTFGFVITVPSDQSHLILLDLLQSIEAFSFSGGKTGTGKSHRAFAEAGDGAYFKGPTSKFWDGYWGQTKVIIDEFRGAISVEHLLRWLDKYPVMVDIKGSATPLRADSIWITSNIPPEQWYPGIDDETIKALRRRFTHVVHYDGFDNSGRENVNW